MNGYAWKEIFTAREQVLWIRAAQMVASMPECDASGELIRCHELARAIGQELELEVCDGRFGFVEHSWLWLEKPDWVTGMTKRWNMPRILDVYVPGSLPMVQLVDSHTGLPSRYLADEPRTDIRVDVVRALVAICRSVPALGAA